MSNYGSDERVPPHSNDAEAAVLGAVLLEPKAMGAVATLLNTDDFYRADHQRVFGAFQALFTANSPIDVVTVRDYLTTHGNEDLAGSADLFMKLGAQVPSVANATFYAETVANYAQLRRLVGTGNEMTCKAYEAAPEDAQAVADAGMQALLDVQQRRLVGKPMKAQDTIHDVVTCLLNGDTQKQWGLRTGFSRMDEMTMGLHAGELTVVAGAPSSGKTTWALNVVHNVLLDGADDCPGILFFSLEMNREQLCQNLLCRAAEVNSSQLRTGRLDKEEWKKVRDAAKQIYKAELYIDDTAAQNVNDMRAKARAHVAEHDTGLVVVDYLQLACATVAPHATKETEIEAISHGMKNLAKELKLPVLALSQLNRAVGDGSGRPKLSRLRGSGAIEQDADLVVFLHHDGEDRADDYRPQEGLDVQLIIGKQRNGPRGTLPFKFYQHRFAFGERELYKDEDDDDLPAVV